MKHLIGYGLKEKHYSFLQECQNREKLQQLYKEIRDTLFKLNTFFLVSKRPFNVDDWLLFSKANLIEECQKYLKQVIICAIS